MANLEGAILWGANLKGADFTDSNLQGAKIKKAILANAIFKSAIVESLINRLKQSPNQYIRSELVSYIVKGQDGVFFLDYLYGLKEWSKISGHFDELFEAHKKAILEQVELNRSSSRVLIKYRWLAEYHNYKFSELFNEEDYVNGYFNELRKQLLVPPTAFPSFEKIKYDESDLELF